MENQPRIATKQSTIVAGKKQWTKSRILLVVLLSALLYTQSLSADIVNGDFSEDPEGFGWTYSPANISVTSNTTSLWDLNGKAVLRPDNPEHTETLTSWLNQLILVEATDLNKSLSFDMTMASGPTPECDTFTASFGTESYPLSSSDLPPGDPYAPYYQRVAFELTDFTPGSYNLRFELVSEPDDGVFTSVIIDNVELNVVPLPSAVMLGAVGLGVANWRLRRRQTL